MTKFRGVILLGAAGWLLVGLLGGTHLGCASIEMTAAGAPSPVLLGPVPCIGCGARPPQATEPPPRWQIAQARRRAIAAFTFVDSANEKSYLFDSALTRNPCGEDFQLTDLRASGWVFSIPILFYMAQLSIDAEVTRAVVAGKCKSAP